MAAGINGKAMSVLHREAAEKSEGQNVGKKLIDVISDYAWEHELKVFHFALMHMHNSTDTRNSMRIFGKNKSAEFEW